MKSPYIRQKALVLSVLVLLVTASCTKYEKNTTASIKEPKRHYYAVVRGQKLKAQFEIFNTGRGVLRIKEIQKSCGCVLVHAPDAIPEGKSGFISLTYDSTKNIGLVDLYIYIYANLKDKKPLVINFDTHVVPSAHYTKDYEEWYQEKTENKLKLDENSNASEKRYYTDADFKNKP